MQSSHYSKFWFKNPYTKFCLLTYAQTLERVPFSGSLSINSKCLRRSEFPSYSLQHSETFMLCLGSTSVFYDSRVPQRRKAKLWDSFHMFPLSQGSPSYTIYSSIPDNSCPTYFTLFYIFSFWGKMERRKGCY